MTETSILDRYQDFRTRRFLKQERTYANSLPTWRNRHRRRMLVIGLAVTFAFMAAVAVLCAFGLWWAPLLWLPACVAFFPMWTVLQLVSAGAVTHRRPRSTNSRSPNATAPGPSG